LRKLALCVAIEQQSNLRKTLDFQIYFTQSPSFSEFEENHFICEKHLENIGALRIHYQAYFFSLIFIAARTHTNKKILFGTSDDLT